MHAVVKLCVAGGAGRQNFMIRDLAALVYRMLSRFAAFPVGKNACEAKTPGGSDILGAARVVHQPED